CSTGTPPRRRATACVARLDVPASTADVGDQSRRLGRGDPPCAPEPQTLPCFRPLLARISLCKHAPSYAWTLPDAAVAAISLASTLRRLAAPTSLTHNAPARTTSGGRI